jgi:hypothetical protein
MPAMHIPRALALAIAACTLVPAAASATTLYKSIGPNGVVQFSDTPPENGVVVEERIVGDAGSLGQAVPGAAGAPLAFANPLEAIAAGVPLDEALARANAQVDLAEHQLALARGSAWTRREGLRLDAPRRKPTDAERVAFYERNLGIARAHLLELLREARKMGTVPFFSLAEQDVSGNRVLAQR